MTQIVISGNWLNKIDCHASFKRDDVDLYFLPTTVNKKQS